MTIIPKMNNQAAIHCIRNCIDNLTTKHFDLRIQYIHENVYDGVFKVEYVSSTDNLADVLTKAKKNYVD